MIGDFYFIIIYYSIFFVQRISNISSIHVCMCVCTRTHTYTYMLLKLIDILIQPGL